MKVVTGAINHETSTFTTVPTTWESFKSRFGYLKGEEILKKFRGTNTPTGGFISGSEENGFELVPTVHANAHPSGPTPRDIFDEILNDLLQGIADAGKIDGVLLELHGAMVADGIDDAEGHILEAVRELVGLGVIVVAQLDIHANVSKRMVDMADILIGRKTYPEVDMADRGRECADLLMRSLHEGLRPTMALHQIPLVWGMNQVTAHTPMSEAITELHRIVSTPRVMCGSIATCFPLSDVPDMGASVYVVTDGDEVIAQACADELGEWIFNRRADWQLYQPTTHEALALADEGGCFPAIFADRNDNTGGGAPGDSTGMLQSFLDGKLKNACVLYIVDSKAVEQCWNAGLGATLSLDVGGKSSPMQGNPCQMVAEVVALSDGHFFYDGPMWAGLEGYMGPSAHILQGELHVILISQREQPFDTAFALTLDLDPREMRYVGVKSAAHFRASFEAWSGVIYSVSENSVHHPSGGSLVYKRLGRKLYPFDII